MGKILKHHEPFQFLLFLVEILRSVVNIDAKSLSLWLNFGNFSSPGLRCRPVVPINLMWIKETAWTRC